MHSEDNIYVISNFFTEKEVDEFCNNYQTQTDENWTNAEISGNQPYRPEIRKTKIKTLHPKYTDLFLTKFVYGVVEANERKFNKNITSYLLEPLNLLKYSDDSSLFKAHCDNGDSGVTAKRQLSAIVILSNIEDYEGGGLVFYGNKNLENRFRLHTAKGALIVFPSDMNHEVTPVTSGTRLSLVMWVG